MAIVQCKLCSNPAKEKCASCGNVYCVQHIQLTGATYTCDTCLAEAAAQAAQEAAIERAATQRETEKEESSQNIFNVGCFTAIGAIALSVILLFIHVDLGTALTIGLAVLVIGGIIVVVGVFRGGF